MASLHVSQVDQASSTARPAPTWDQLTYAYYPSKDGIDENLLILFHGFGDSHVPFAKLGRSLSLPQTATLAIRAPELIPFLLEDDPEGFQWYATYSPLGEFLTNPNPTDVLSSLLSFIRHLIEVCTWPSERIHLFGFGQGGTIAAELALKLWRESNTSQEMDTRKKLGSVVTITGPLLSYPTGLPCPTPLLIVHRPGTEQSALTNSDLAALRKGFGGRIVEEQLAKEKEGMPTNKDEWLVVMRFWADVLERAIRGEGVYRVG